MTKKYVGILILPLVVMILILSFTYSSMASEPTQESAERQTPIDPKVWADILADPDRKVDFTIVVVEANPGDPESAVQAQMGLEFLLETMVQNGGLDYYRVHYGLNAIQVRGSWSAIRSLSRWPAISEINVEVRDFVDKISVYEVHEISDLSATGQFTGTVSGPDEITPLQGIRVRAYQQTGPTSWLLVASVFTGEDGSYTITGLETGIYRAEFIDPNGDYVPEFYNDKQDFILATNFSVTDGATTPNINASLAQGGKISGTITENVSGNPVVDIVASTWYTATGSWHQASSGTSKSDGTFTIGGLAPGAYKVYFSDSYTPDRYVPEYYDNVFDIEDSTNITVTAGVTTTGINASLGAYGSLSGTVYAMDGVTPLEDIYVDVYRYNNSWLDWEWISYDQTDGSGAYQVGGLVTENYRVEFTDPIGQFATEVYNDKPDLDSGDDIPVTLGMETTGIDATLELAVVDRNIELAPDWNLISSPLMPTNPDTETALSSLGYDLITAWAYDGCASGEPWTTYDPTAPSYVNDLDYIDAEHGYWMQTTVTKTLTLSGTLPLSTEISLCEGWNLIGYPSPTNEKVTNALADIDGKYDLVYGYDAWDFDDPWELYIPGAPPQVSDLKRLRAGYGYWIRMTQPATLIIPGR